MSVSALSPAILPSAAALASRSLTALSRRVPPVAAAAVIRTDPSPREFLTAPGPEFADAVLNHAKSRGFQLHLPAVSGMSGSTLPRLRASGKHGRDFGLVPPEVGAPATKPRQSWPAAIWVLLTNLVLTQVGVEALGLAIPQFARDRFSFATMAAVSSASAIALAAGSLLGGQASDKLGPERTYVATLILRAGFIAAMACFYSLGLLSAPLLIGLFAADYVLHCMNYVAIDTLAPARLGPDPVRLNRFGFYRQGIIDMIGFVSPLAAGLAIAAWGYAAVFWTYPVLFLISAAGGAGVLRGALAARAHGDGYKSSNPTSGWLAALSEIVKSPALRLSVLGFTLLNVTSLSLYFMIGPAFGSAAAAASGGTAAQITSVMTGLFAGGGILGLALQSLLTSRLERASQGAPAPQKDAAVARALTRLMGWAMSAAGVAMLAFWALLDTAPVASFSLFSIFIPLYLGQLLMLPLGAALSIPWVGLGTILQSRSSRGARAKTAGVNRFAAMFATFGFSYILGGLFSALSGSGAPVAASFTALAGVMTALGGAAALVGWRLLRAAR